jgi:hypothetical protein
MFAGQQADNCFATDNLVANSAAVSSIPKLLGIPLAES